jgi:chromosome segregation ATPase
MNSPNTTNSTSTPARSRSVRSGAGTPLSARAAVKKPGAPSNLSSSTSPDDGEEEARLETASLIQELKDRLQKAEAASEEYQKQAEVLQTRLDDAVKEQAKLEERIHEDEERIEGLENEKRESLRQRRELDTIYESERAAAMKEKEAAQLREEELQEVIQRLKDGLSQKESQRDALKPTDNEEGRLSRNCKCYLYYHA